ncbi:MAG: phosphate ABC transporter substrate-binding protein PstS [Candidatus Dormiibacterota bacterium]
MHLRRLAATAALATVGLLAGCGTTSTTPSTGGTSDPTCPSSTQLSAACDITTDGSETLNGAGANSIEPFFTKVFYEYHQADPKTVVNYSPAGSSVGISDIEQEIVDFGDTEIPMAASDLAKAPGAVLQVPVDLGGVAISYNIPGAPRNLKLDAPTLAGIFDGTITQWNDPRIARVSGDSNLPDLAIVPVHRADSSGPGWDLDDYLILNSPAWVAKIGTSKPSKTWPLATVGIGEQLNTGVASYVHQTVGAIGFVEYGYALQAGFVNAALQNRSGSFVAPSLQSVAAAGAEATTLSASNFSIIDEPGAGSYPLANFSWTLLYQRQPDQLKGIALGKLFDWVVTAGQQQSSALGFAPLPANVAQLAVQTLEQLQSSAGSPLFSP